MNVNEIIFRFQKQFPPTTKQKKSSDHKSSSYPVILFLDSLKTDFSVFFALVTVRIPRDFTLRVEFFLLQILLSLNEENCVH